MIEWFCKQNKAEEEKERRDLLLTILYLFKESGREEVSFGEIHDSISDLNEIMPRRYIFSEKLSYSSELMEDLKRLNYNSFIRYHQYKYDSLLPRKFVSLTLVGEGYSRKIGTKLHDEIKNRINIAIAKAIENYKNCWRLWKR